MCKRANGSRSEDVKMYNKWKRKRCRQVKGKQVKKNRHCFGSHFVQDESVQSVKALAELSAAEQRRWQEKWQIKLGNVKYLFAYDSGNCLFKDESNAIYLLDWRPNESFRFYFILFNFFLCCFFSLLPQQTPLCALYSMDVDKQQTS